MFAQMRHMAIVTSNAHHEGDFYHDVLGMKRSTLQRAGGAVVVSDGYVGLNLNPHAPGRQAGFDHFGFEVDEKLLPFAIEEFGDQCWVYGSDIPHGDRLYGAVDVFLKRDDISEESKRKLLVDNTARFYGLSK